MEFSESIANIAEALSKFQGEIANPPKNKTVSFATKTGRTSYKYADLADIADAIRPAMTKNGLVFLQNPTQDKGSVSVYTIIVHSSGEKIEFDPVTLQGNTNDPKAVGSLLTYARRYSLCSALGIASDEDTDGDTGKEPKTTKQQNTNNTRQQTQKKEPQKPLQPQYTAASLKATEEIGYKWSMLGHDPEKLELQLVKSYGRVNITSEQAADFIATLDAAIKDKQAEPQQTEPAPAKKVEEPTEPLASPGQVKAICAIAGAKKLTDADQKLYIKREYGVSSRKELTKAQAHEVLNTFSKHTKEELHEVIKAYHVEAEPVEETEAERKKKCFNGLVGATNTMSGWGGKKAI